MKLPHDRGAQHSKNHPAAEIRQQQLAEDARMVATFMKGLPDQAPHEVQEYVVGEIMKGVHYHAKRFGRGRIVLSHEDCMSAAVVHVLQHLHQWKHECTLRTFAAITGRHYLLNLISSRKHLDTAGEHEAHDHLHNATEAHHDRANVHLDDEERALHHHIAALRGVERQVIGQILCGKHIGEIAKQLSLSRETIRKYKTSAFARLRRALGQR